MLPQVVSVGAWAPIHSLIWLLTNICGLRAPGVTSPEALFYYQKCAFPHMDLNLKPTPQLIEMEWEEQWLSLREEKDKETIKLMGHFHPKDPYWTRTDIGNWARPVGENHIFLDPTLVPPPSLRDKNPHKTIEKRALFPTSQQPWELFAFL